MDNDSPKAIDPEEDTSASLGVDDDVDEGSGPATRRRRARTFPAMSFAEAMVWPAQILAHGAGKPIRRLTLLETIQRSPTSSATRSLITASNQYGLTAGGYNAENVELTRKGRAAVDPTVPRKAQLTAQFELSIDGIAPFKTLFDTYAGSRLPAVGVLRDAARDTGLADEHVAECVETFLANARGLGLIANIAGSEHVLRLADVLDKVGEEDAAQAPSSAGASTIVEDPGAHTVALGSPGVGATSAEFEDVCFVISPIGEAGSEARMHADLVLNHLIAPALEELNLRPIRADQISRPGMITNQVMEHLVRSKLVIADLSFANPNVYYELAVRHAARRPAVQLTRSIDRLPFDVGQFRTVVMDMSDIYALVPQLELHRAEIARQARAAIDRTTETESPISRFYPSFWEETFVDSAG